MIHDFLQIIRSMSSHPVVLFFCLDPSFPGINDILTYDVDGFLTNSHITKQQLEEVMPGRVEYVMLAADPELMRRNESVTREYNGVYVGAGGRMLEYKPDLLEMITSALPFGLKLYGMGWDEMVEDTIRSASGGVLPRYDIANAYSSAHVVLASTIEAQRSVGMINNRIFEAMSCGSLLLSDHSEALEALAEGTMLFYKNGEDVHRHMKWILAHHSEASQMGEQARQLILRKHSWAHRSVQIMSFVAHLAGQRAIQKRCCSRPNCPTMVWVVANGLKYHSDYKSVLESHVFSEVCQDYKVKFMEEEAFVISIQMEDEEVKGTNLSKYEAFMLIMSPFDRLDITVRQYYSNRGVSLSRAEVKMADKGFGRLQKWLTFYIGVPVAEEYSAQLALSFDKMANQHIYDINNDIRSENTPNNTITASDLLSFRMYDLVLFRTRAEMQSFRKIFSQKNLPKGHENKDPCGDGALRCEVLFAVSEDLVVEASSKSRLMTLHTKGGAEEKSKDKIRAPWFEDPGKDPRFIEPIRDHEEVNRLRAQRVKRRQVSPTAVVCFWEYSHLCTRGYRQAMMTNSGLEEGSYHLVLLGGTFDQWVHLDTSEAMGTEREILAYEYLHRVVHVAQNQVGLQAASILQQVKTVYFMHGSGFPSEQPCDLHSVLGGLLGSVGGEGMKAKETVCASRDDTTIWPLVVAAINKATIHMWEGNALYLAAAKLDDLKNYDAKYLTTAVQRTVCKAHGLGSATSQLALQPAGVLEFSLADIDYLSTFVERAQGLAEESLEGVRDDLTRLSVPVTLRETPLSMDGISEIRSYDDLISIGHIKLAIRLDLQNFHAGRDGDLCFQVVLPHARRQPFGSPKDTPPYSMRYLFEDEVLIPRGCLMRKDFPVVALNLTMVVRRGDSNDFAVSMSGILTRLAHATLEVYARGNMFADTVQYKQYSVLPYLQSNAREIVREQKIDTSDMTAIDIDLLL